MARHYCQKCTKPEDACLCEWLKPQENSIAVIVFQHPDEKNKPIGTAKLVELGLTKIQVVCSSTISEEVLFQLLDNFKCSRPLLIYPNSLNDAVPHYVYDFEKERFTSLPLKNNYDSIILLDGTWRNTRELLLRNPWLKKLPTLNLLNAGASRYRIRQANKEGALATIEAVSKALVLMDNTFLPEHLLLPFEKMIEFQISKMGQSVYQKNYIEMIDNNKSS